MSARRVGLARTGLGDLKRLSPSFQTKVMTLPNLAVYGRNDEAIGTSTIADYSGGGHTGTYTQVLLGSAGLLPNNVGNGAYYPGSGVGSNGIISYGSWMDAPTALSLYCVAQSVNAANIQSLLDRDDGSSNRVWQFRTNASGRLEFIKIGGTGGVVTSTDDTVAGNNSVDGRPRHYGATYDGSNIRLYRDGAKVKTTSAAGTLGTAAQQLQLGRNSGAAAFFVGTMHHWFVCNGVLSDQDFADLYALR